MKKVFILFLAIVLLACSCVAAYGENISENTTEATVKILSERVVEVSYSSFDIEKAAAYLGKFDMQMGGCSAVRVLLNGKVYVGRNYDFYCSNAPAFIVRNNAGKIRTIGLANDPDHTPVWTENYELPQDRIDILPFECCDVMSEAGLYAETNIRIREDALMCSSSNPGAPRRCTQAFMTTMLSQYATIDEILAHVDDYDWFDLSMLGFEQSFFITDQSGRSVVIEFGGNSWSWTETDFNANYFFNNDLYAIEKYPCGEMRVSKELSYLPYVRTEEDIFTMMEKGAYAQFYTADVDPEYALPEFAEEVGYNALDPSTHDAAIEKVKELIKKYSAYTWEDMVSNHCWESTFIVAANVTDLTLNVHFSEHYGLQFTASFSD